MYVFAIYCIVLYLYTLNVPYMCISIHIYYFSCQISFDNFLIWWMYQKLILVEVQRLSICRLSATCGTLVLHPSSPKLKDHSGSVRKDCKRRWPGLTWRKQNFWIVPGSCTLEHWYLWLHAEDFHWGSPWKSQD